MPVIICHNGCQGAVVMANPVHYVPEGYHSITPYLIIQGAAAAIEFYKQAFGAVEVVRMPGPDGTIGHAELRIGDSFVMMADQPAQQQAPVMSYAPAHYGGSPVALLLYTPNVDAVAQAAVAAGATMKRPPEDQFYGDRACILTDPFGHQWYVHTHIRDVSPEEMKKLAGQAGGT
jgi:PhnB protein